MGHSYVGLQHQYVGPFFNIHLDVEAAEQFSFVPHGFMPLHGVVTSPLCNSLPFPQEIMEM